MNAPSSLAQTNILLIEDTPSDAAIVSAYLEDEGDEPFHVIHAPNMETATHFMAEMKIHAVMLDLFLPDTEELSGLISVRSYLPSVPILILTGREDEDMALLAVERGAQDYLLKDKVNPRMLRRSIKYAMQRKKFEDRITYQANFDGLTLLPNRQHFKERLDIALARSLRSKQSLIVMMMDLNGFKGINDTYGHEAGDVVLKEVAVRIRDCLRPYDLAARFGGDEFLILIEDVQKTSDVLAIAQKLIAVIAQPIPHMLNPVSVGASIGVAFARADENLSVDMLLKRADEAMYEAKRTGRSNVSFYGIDGRL